MTDAAIGEIVGRSRQAVNLMRNKYGRHRKRAAAERASLAGKTAVDVAAELGVTVRRAYQIIGVRSLKPRVAGETREEIVRLHGEGESTRRIAERLGVSRGVVLRTLAARKPVT